MKKTVRRRRGPRRGRPAIRLGRGLIAGIALVVVVVALIVSRAWMRT